MLTFGAQATPTSLYPGLLEEAAKIKTPLGLAALSFVILFLLYREIVGRSAGLSSKGTERVVRSVFVLTLVALCLGFGGYVVHVLLADDPFVRVYGRVTTAQDNTVGVPNATVHMQLDTITDIAVMSAGDFAFSLPRSFIGRTAHIWATADGYQESSVQELLISPISRNINLSMTHMAVVGSAPKDPKCVSGSWLEKPGGNFIWQITAATDSVHLSRGDGWAQGDFRLDGAAWIGSLHWGNGTVWPGVSLSPDEACAHISTNKDWWYERSK